MQSETSAFEPDKERERVYERKRERQMHRCKLIDGADDSTSPSHRFLNKLLRNFFFLACFVFRQGIVFVAVESFANILLQNFNHSDHFTATFSSIFVFHLKFPSSELLWIILFSPHCFIATLSLFSLFIAAPMQLYFLFFIYCIQLFTLLI